MEIIISLMSIVLIYTYTFKLETTKYTKGRVIFIGLLVLLIIASANMKGVV